MEVKNITCIICPIGCDITVKGDKANGVIESITGHKCKRGEKYSKDEFIHPLRIITSTAKVQSELTPLVPIRSSKPIPKELLMECMKQIQNIDVKAPIDIHQVLIANILNTGADIIATAVVER